MKMAMMWFSLVFLLVGTERTVTLSIYGNKTIIIAGIFDLESQSTNNPNPQIGIHFAEAVLFAIDQVNKNSSLLYGFKFASNAEQHNIVQLAGDSSINVNTIIYGFFAGSKKQAALGPYKTYDSYKLSIVTNALRYPVISYSAPFISTKNNKNYFFRTVPEDSFRALAVVDLLVKLSWDFIAVISSFDRDGDNIARAFIKKASDKRICYSHHVSLREDATKADYEQAIADVTSTNEARGLILFTTMDDSRGLLQVLQNRNMTNRFQIVAAFGFTNYVEITRGNEDILEGAISVEYATKEVPKFREHFLSLNMTSRNYPKFAEFWEWTFGCKMSNKGGNNKTKNCTGDEKLRPGFGYYPQTPVHLAINAIYSLAFAFRRIIEIKCTKPGYCGSWNPTETYYYFEDFGKYLRNNSFADATLHITDPVTNLNNNFVQYEYLNFVRNSSKFMNKKVGNWSFQRDGMDKTGAYYLENNYNGTIELEVAGIKWRASLSIVASSCRQPCPHGSRRVASSNYRLSKCCWSCQECAKNAVTKQNICKDCGKDNKPDDERKSCVLLPTKYFGSQSPQSLALHLYMGLSSFGIICSLFVVVMFIKNNDNRIVRASGRELCYFMLAGIGLMFTIPFTFYFEPSKTVCSLQTILPGLALCVCYSPLFLKTNRIHRIFCNAQTTISRPPLISPQSQIFLLLFIICIQILLGVIWIVSNRPDAQRFYNLGEYAILHCGEDGTKMILNMLFSVIFMICCTWYAFKTRNFPKNYNESKYIGFTMYITCICWAVFMPMYFISNEDEKYMRPHLICIVMICIGFLTLLGLFGQKIRLLLFPCLVDENGKQGAMSQASRVAADPNKYQMKIHKIDALSMCKEPSLIHSNSVVVNKSADKT